MVHTEEMRRLDKAFHGRLNQHGIYLTYLNAAAPEPQIWAQIDGNGLGLKVKEYLDVASMAVPAPFNRQDNLVRFNGRNFRVTLGKDIQLEERLYSTVVEISLVPTEPQPTQSQ